MEDAVNAFASGPYCVSIAQIRLAKVYLVLDTGKIGGFPGEEII